MLYIIPTPIGNLQDITLRALETLKNVDLIACEDTRITQKLLSHFDIQKQLIPYHDHNKHTHTTTLIQKLKQGEHIGLVSDAGTPGISDPGYELIQACITENIHFEALPGATAVIPSLVGSGLPTDQFLFCGYIPKKKNEQKKWLQQKKEYPFTLIMYETAPRLISTVKSIHNIFGNRNICIAKEISKLHETFIRTDKKNILQQSKVNKKTQSLSLKNNDIHIKGEFVLVIEGYKKKTQRWTHKKVQQCYKERLENGEKPTTAAKHVAQQSGWKKSEVYEVGI